MSISFDLISDLHVDTWEHEFDWTGCATSPYCIVAGDVSKNRQQMVQVLRHLGQCYQAVFYIDGNDEHVENLEHLSPSYASLARQIQKIPNVVYLQDNVVVVDGVAVVGTNGWWGYDLDLSIDPVSVASWWQDKAQVSDSAVKAVAKMATTDATYLVSSIRRLQSHQDVKKIVVVTHTVPLSELIEHDIELEGTMRFNCMGNAYMQQVLMADHMDKIHTWCFGHYHGSIDQIRHGVRFVNNCRGRGNTPWNQYVYHPRRIVVDLN
jgi:UDP-2,3-diacylglucosamine pyrophosphatase LpxH